MSQGTDAVAVRGVEVVLVGDALRDDLRVHSAGSALGAGAKEVLQGPGGDGLVQPWHQCQPPTALVSAPSPQH